MDDDSQRSVTITRLDRGAYRATNAAGATLEFGSRVEGQFSPVELLLAAIGGCSAIDVDFVTTRRAEPERFDLTVGAASVTDEDGGHLLRDVRVTFDLRFPPGEDGDKARARIDSAVRVSHDKDCTVSRTVEAATPVTFSVATEG